jgi:hypothetical protein
LRVAGARVVDSSALLAFDDGLHADPGQFGQRQAAEERREELDLLRVVADRGLVRLLVQPAQRRVFPAVLGLVAQLGLAPQVVLQPVVQLLGRLAASCLSRLSNSVSTWRRDVDPPGRGLRHLPPAANCIALMRPVFTRSQAVQ